MKSHFASAERKSINNIIRENQTVLNIPILRDIFNRLPHLLMVLNSERQMVFANLAMLHFLSIEDYQEILGSRPGEIFNCIHAWENEAGCGTSFQCQYCGAVQALLTAQWTHERSVDLHFTSDNVILRRIMLNLLKNAFEACSDSDIIQFGCKYETNNLIFWVYSPTVILDAIQAQLFEHGTTSN